MAEYLRVLKYPLLAWFVLDTVFVIGAKLVPASGNIMDSFVSNTVVALPLGAMAAYKMIEFKGNTFHAMVAGLITGLWCAVLAVTEVGIILSPIGTYNPMDSLPSAFALFILNVIGAIVGAGFALTRGKS